MCQFSGAAGIIGQCRVKVTCCIALLQVEDLGGARVREGDVEHAKGHNHQERQHAPAATADSRRADAAHHCSVLRHCDTELLHHLPTAAGQQQMAPNAV